MKGTVLRKLIGAIILMLCSIYIYQKFSKNDIVDWSLLEIRSILFETRGVLILGVILIMTFVNWFLEAGKWKFLLKKIHSLTLWRAYASVFMGLAFTILTPFRVGSFIGRIWNFPKKQRFESALASVFGGLGQLFITVCMGLIGLYFQLSNAADLPIRYLGLFSIVLLFLVFLVYFWPSKLINISNKFMPSFNFSKSFEVLVSYDVNDKLIVLGYSLMRYLVFLIQYYLLIKLFNPEVHLSDFFWPLSLIFFVMSVVPSLIFGIGLRETIAVLLLGPLVGHEETIVVASLLLWLSNMIIPASIGGFIFLFKKTVRS